LLGYQSFFSIIITAFIIAFTFLPVRDKIQSLVDRTFFHQRQELEELIRDFGLTVEFSFDREFILRATVNTVLRIVEVKRISVMIINEAGEYLVSTALGLAPEKWDIKFDASNCVVTWLAKEKRPLLRREVNENPDLRWIRDDLIRELDRIDAVLIIPLISHDRLLGLLNLGRKISEVGFREEEIVLLETLAEAATLAFENIKFFDERVNLVLNTIDALCMAIEAQNKYAKGHAQRVAYYATLVAKELGLDDKTIETVKIASFLHDIGNVGVSEEILNLNRRLTPEEFDKVKLHTLIGVNLIQDINLEKETIECILSHHERLDGSGYPHASKGEAIPISARIVSVVDVYDAMIHDRPYRKAFSQEEALREIRNGKGIKFDPNVVDALIRVLGREGKVKKERNIA
jgi:putative nucleotidyltransferase with HDIG domain